MRYVGRSKGRNGGNRAVTWNIPARRALLSKSLADRRDINIIILDSEERVEIAERIVKMRATIGRCYSVTNDGMDRPMKFRKRQTVYRARDRKKW